MIIYEIIREYLDSGKNYKNAFERIFLRYNKYYLINLKVKMKKNIKRKALAIYNVAKILDKKEIKGKQFYLIEWEGFSLEEATWEPYQNIKENCLDMIKEFEKKVKIKKEQQTFEKNSKEIKNSTLENDKIYFRKKISFNEKFFQQGSLQTQDIPKSIIFVRRDTNKNLLCAVEWHIRKDGFKPNPSFCSNEEIKSYDPKILIDYYEKKLRFLN